MQKVTPRIVPTREQKYMGLAWFYASFSKDPYTQVGAVIIHDDENSLVGWGYNGPPSDIDDHSFSWHREKNTDMITKYDLIVHAEENAIKHAKQEKLRESTLFVTALPCPKCMLEIVHYHIANVVYFDFQGSEGSSLNRFKDKTHEMARMGRVNLHKFSGSVGWMADWNEKLRQMGVFSA